MVPVFIDIVGAIIGFLIRFVYIFVKVESHISKNILKKQTKGNLNQLIKKQKKLLKNYQLMIESRKCKKMKRLLQ